METGGLNIRYFFFICSHLPDRTYLKSLKMMVRILLLSLIPILSFAQSNSKVAAPVYSETNIKGPLEPKRNTFYNLDEIKVRWKKAALENCPGVPCPSLYPPGPCSSIVATPTGPTSASVSFGLPTYDGGSPITGYVVTATPTSSAPAKRKSSDIITATGTAPPIIVTGLTLGVNYIFSVLATNIVGPSPNIATTTTVTPCVLNTASAASSSPTLTVNTILTNIRHLTTIATGIGTATGLPSGVTASWLTGTLTISGTPTVTGTFNYTIPLTGGCGIVNATGTITVTAATSAILTTMAVSSITATGASSGGTISSDGGGPITAKGVVWLTSTAPTVSLSTKTTDGTGTGTFTSTISGLVESTTYYVRAYATNAAGTSYGTELTFSTPTAPTVPGAPTNVTAVAGNAQAIVSFTAPSSAGGSVITGYTVTSSPAGGTGTATGTSSSITVTGLTNGTNYTFSVVARNAVGSSSPGVSNAVTPAQGFSCGTSTVLDGDGNPYNTVVIDGQCWTKENLKTTKYNDGITVIPFGSLGSKTNPTITGARTEITGVDISTFGYLYNWYAAAGIFSSEPLTSPKNICPLDWHVPTDNDWTNLTVYLGDSPGSQLKSKSMMWNPNSGTDNFGFSAFPTGLLDEDSRFTNNGSIAVFWSATNVTQSDKAWLRYLLSSNGIVNKYTSNYDGSYKSVGASVRCLKD